MHLEKVPHSFQRKKITFRGPQFPIFSIFLKSSIILGVILRTNKPIYSQTVPEVSKNTSAINNSSFSTNFRQNIYTERLCYLVWQWEGRQQERFGLEPNNRCNVNIGLFVYY